MQNDGPTHETPPSERLSGAPDPPAAGAAWAAVAPAGLA